MYAAVHGTVVDPSGAAVAAAMVRIYDTQTGVESIRYTDKLGYYLFPQLSAGGPYTVTISSGRFSTFVATGLVLSVNDNREVDARLGIAAVTQTLRVTALGVETANTQIQQTVTQSQLESLPLEGRDPAGLQKLEPGVVESSDRFGTFASNGSETPQNAYMVDGIDINDPELQKEGIQINPDALAEENIVTGTMNAQYPRNSGAVVNQILRSGTNQLHGSGYEFYRDTFLNNGDYFSPARPVFHQNLYGGTLGGPLLPSRLFFFAAYQGMRNRTAQTTLQTTLSPQQFNGDFTADVNYATGAADSQGLSANPIPFSLGSCVANPSGAAPMTWAQCFATGQVQIPAAQWNPIAAALVRQYVLPQNQTRGGTPYANFNAVNTGAEDQGVFRLDDMPGDRDTFWLSSVIESSPSTTMLTFGGSGFPGMGSNQADHFKLFSAAWTHTFGANLLNELRGAYFRNPYGAFTPAAVTSPSAAGFAISPQDPVSSLPWISVGSYLNLGFSYEGPQPRLDTNATFSDNLTWVRGNHSVKAGASIERFRVRNPYDIYNNGAFSFQGGTEGGGRYSSGDPLIDFVLGIPDTYYQTNNGLIDVIASETYAYAQDNWKVSSNLALNYGLAWDVEEPYQNRQDGGLGVTCWQSGEASSTVFPGGPPGLTWPGDPGCNSAGAPTARLDHFAPRVGFAWSPSSGPAALFGAAGAHSFSLRGGFGVYYNRDQEEQSLQNLMDPPFLYVSTGAAAFGGSPSFSNPFADVAGNGSMSNPFPIPPFKAGGSVDWSAYLPLQLAVFSPAYAVPYTYNFNFNIQRALGTARVAQLAYAGSLSHRLSTWSEGDAITPSGHAQCLANPLCTANPGIVHLLFPQYTMQPATIPGNPYGLPFGTPYYVSVVEQASEGASNYNALQASLIQAPSHGLAYTLAYTWSHALDDGSGYEDAAGRQGRLRNGVPGYESLNYGNSDFDARERLSASYVYDLPSPAFGNRLVRNALAGWKVAGITALETGFPIEIYETSARSLWCDGYSDFGCADVPAMNGFRFAKHNPRVNPQYFNASYFTAEPIGTFGNTPRNFLHGPGFNYTNLQLAKNFFVGPDRQQRVELRVEAFNAFNHANFANPSGNFNSPSFGQITSVVHSADPNADPSPGRALQLAGKFYF